MMKIVKNILLVLSTGYIFVYFSEHLFWARIRPDDSLAGWLGTWIAYSLVAFVFLTLVSYFRVKDLWALFLGGAAFGWLTEGVVVQTTYEMLPLSISFTGLAWHALITVWVGWYAVRRALLSTRTWSVLKLAALIGLLYGLWSITWWLEPDGGVSSPGDYALFSFTTTALAILAYRVTDWSLSEPFVSSRAVIIVAAVLFALYFSLVTVPAAPLALLILPLLLGGVWWGLHRNRRREEAGSLLENPRGSPSLWHYLALFLLPAAAVSFYALAMLVQLQWYTNWILYLVTTPLGFILFGISIYKMGRRKPS